MDWGLLIGLVAIALAIFFGLWSFRKGISDQLSTIKDAVVAIKTTVDKTWDLVVVRFGAGSGTVVRELGHLGKVKITAEPARDKTVYLIEIEKPILKERFLLKQLGEDNFVKQETKILGKEGEITILSPQRVKYFVPSTDPQTCAEFITYFLRWLDSEYVISLKEIERFEEPILP